MVRNTQRNTLLPEVVKHVQAGTEVHTDEHPAYFGLVGPRYDHKIVNHAVTYVTKKAEQATSDAKLEAERAALWRSCIAWRSSSTRAPISLLNPLAPLSA